MRFRRRAATIASVAALAATLAPAPAARQAAAQAVYLTYEDARPVLEAMAGALPSELRGRSPDDLKAAWPAWVAQRDAEIRQRLRQGDEDSVVNLLLFGSTFTTAPRLRLDAFRTLKNTLGADPDALPASHPVRVLARRISDLVAAVVRPGPDDRLQFARRVMVDDRGGRLDTPAGRAEAAAYLRAGVARVLAEYEDHARTIADAQRRGDATGEFVERSRLFRTRGLASDTSLLPNFAVAEALGQIAAKGLVAPRSVRRIAVVGPGLDFTDKEDGHDFYPLQTIQPFAVVDALLRLGLAADGGVRVTTFDLSPRVNAHLAAAAARAARGQPYVLQLPRDRGAGWTPAAIDYWRAFGARIGDPVAPVAPPDTAGDLELRAVRIRPAVAAALTPLDINIVLQHAVLAEADRFDLIVATNIFVYYDTFEQTLALLNVERLLAPGGFLLSNNALLELPAVGVRSRGYTSVAYSGRAGDGDHIVWYQRAAR